MTNEPETAPAEAASTVPWLSTEPAMETSAVPGRMRIVKVKQKNGVYRIGNATYAYATVQNPAGTVREHLYRVSLQWLAEYDLRDGSMGRFNERAASRPTNTLQFRVLETTKADGKRLVSARLGPHGQILAEPKALGVMSFLRGILAEWVVERHPDAAIVHSPLAHPDTTTDDEKALRDSFFARSGFTVRTAAEGGHFFAPSIQDLKRSWNAEKVVEIAPSVIAEALCTQVEVAALRKQISTHEAEIQRLNRERRSAEIRGRIWIAVTLLSIAFAVIFGIQPRVA